MRLRYQWHHVDDLKPPQDVHVIGLHSEWESPLVVVQRKKKWYGRGPLGEELLSRHNVSDPLHWARMPIGFAKIKGSK